MCIHMIIYSIEKIKCSNPWTDGTNKRIGIANPTFILPHPVSPFDLHAAFIHSPKLGQRLHQIDHTGVVGEALQTHGAPISWRGQKRVSLVYSMY